MVLHRKAYKPIVKRARQGAKSQQTGHHVQASGDMDPLDESLPTLDEIMPTPGGG